jgi:regulator of sigma E protease
MIISGAIMAGQLFLGLSLLVGLHEFGHLIAAKIFGMRVEKFAIGFPPKMWSFQWGETEYAFQLIPLGGYVKISGMVDESMDTDFVATEPQPWEFRSKPAWQRLIVMLGGIIMNVIVGIVVFTFINFSQGTRYLPIEEANKGGFYPNELGEKMGFEYGDKVIAMNGEAVERASEIMNPNFLLEAGNYYTVLRANQELKIEITTEFIREFSSNQNSTFFISPLSKFEITSVTPNTGAAKGGLKAQDKIISIAGQEINFFQDVGVVVKAHKGETIPFVIERDSEQKTLRIAIDANGVAGFMSQDRTNFLHEKYGLVESVSHGTKDAFNVITVTFSGFKAMFNRDISPTKAIGGPIMIARKAYGGSWNPIRFWTITAFLSMMLAFMNLLPIPALDGGHVMFLLYEMIRGKAPSTDFLIVAQKIGILLLLSLMVFAFGNDIFQTVVELISGT